MKITDCPWELSNLRKKTIEITIENNDVCNKELLSQIYEDYDYVVVKVPMHMIDFNYTLSSLGFVIMEVQHNIHSDLGTIDASNYASIYENITFEQVTTEEQMCELEKLITQNMFSCDRITLDKKFGKVVGRNRYVNWILNNFGSKMADIALVLYQGQKVGFMMYQICNGVFHLILNGLFENFQGKHLGIITPLSPYIFCKKKSCDVNIVKTSISSNNIPVVKLYNKLGFILDSQTYVFVKHN